MATFTSIALTLTIALSAVVGVTTPSYPRPSNIAFTQPRAVVAAAPDPVVPGLPPFELPEIDELIVERFPAIDAAAQFRDDWGNRRSGGRRHQGTDIYADKGAPLLAVADGVVVSMQSGGKGGFTLRLSHADGWETWYMHLDNDTTGTDDGKAGELAAFADGLEVGDSVTAGQVVAYMGDSGNAEDGRPQLHFELLRAGQKVNPYPQLAHAWARYLRTLTLAGSMR